MVRNRRFGSIQLSERAARNSRQLAFSRRLSRHGGFRQDFPDAISRHQMQGPGFSKFGYVLPDSGRILVPENVSSELASLSSCALRSVMNATDLPRRLASIGIEPAPANGSRTLGAAGTIEETEMGAARVRFSSTCHRHDASRTRDRASFNATGLTSTFPSAVRSSVWGCCSSVIARYPATLAKTFGRRDHHG